MVKRWGEPIRSRPKADAVSSIALRKFEFYAIQNERKIESGSAGVWRGGHRKAKLFFYLNRL
jgi:hypothetical protein